MYKGDLEGFPEEVIEKMLERQVEQGNERDVSVFEKERNVYKNWGGFRWDNTSEGYSFWNEVIDNKDFDLFFEKYPNKEKDGRPKRYSSREVSGMDVIDLVKHWNLDFNEGNILKYLLRDKGEDIQDLEKIIDYAQRQLKFKKDEARK